ncbi:MAG: hypothetical protein EWV67_00920 [Microcystis sp. M_QC_C_20170808_M2Col]|nr:MAG: hypothetical protein EWV67_00920 [Microcystis sp. M_QC_C_20170808_M2Col]TRT69367.1 MAG: hypothetical protein EWV68_09155 [Microcystis sp. M_QC_C_20170808_M9Col]
MPVNQENSCSCQKLSDTPLIKGGLRGDRHPPYQGGIKGGSKTKSIFNLIIATYLAVVVDRLSCSPFSSHS